MKRPAAAAAVALFGALLLAACVHTPSRIPPPEVPGGDPARGVTFIQQYGCGSCHVIPGVNGANGLVGPPLNLFARRGYIAGELPNSGDNLIRWIQHPKDVEPNTAMPDLGVTPTQARDIAAYLFTLR
ncbi:MAG TPA: cytochrome C [Actinobacteria bacterium]|jgi:cytochrome c2|nr:cytochrome C [Actinomycetota bacterium]HCP62089.1 cytochrome C [Actinomycetota bacterium]